MRTNEENIIESEMDCSTKSRIKVNLSNILRRAKDDERCSLHFARKITYEMEMAAASALAGVVTINDFCEDQLSLTPLTRMVPIVAKAVSGA